MRWLNEYFPRQNDTFLYRVQVWFPGDREPYLDMFCDWFYFKETDGCHALEHLEDVYHLYRSQNVIVDIRSLECFDEEKNLWIPFGFDPDNVLFYEEHFPLDLF